MAIHRFAPKIYDTTIGSHEPVLTISSGDTVITPTVDAHGADGTGKRVTEGGNPQTGPFCVVGAEPGDMFSVHFDRLWPNRRRGWSSTVIAPWRCFQFNGLSTHPVHAARSGRPQSPQASMYPLIVHRGKRGTESWADQGCGRARNRPLESDPSFRPRTKGPRWRR